LEVASVAPKQVRQYVDPYSRQGSRTSASPFQTPLHELPKSAQAHHFLDIDSHHREAFLRKRASQIFLGRCGDCPESDDPAQELPAQLLSIVDEDGAGARGREWRPTSNRTPFDQGRLGESISKLSKPGGLSGPGGAYELEEFSGMATAQKPGPILQASNEKRGPILRRRLAERIPAQVRSNEWEGGHTGS
jgi:hypothetical protein